MEYQHFWQEILTHKKQSSLACKLYYIRKIKNPLLLQILFFSFLSVTVAWQENWGSCWKWSNQLAPGIRFLLSLLGNHWSAFTFSSGKLIVLYLFLLWGLCFQGLGFAALEGLTPRLNPENQVYEPKKGTVVVQPLHQWVCWAWEVSVSPGWLWGQPWGDAGALCCKASFTLWGRDTPGRGCYICSLAVPPRTLCVPAPGAECLLNQFLWNFKPWLKEVFLLNVYLDQGIVPLFLWKQSCCMRGNGT